MTQCPVQHCTTVQHCTVLYTLYTGALTCLSCPENIGAGVLGHETLLGILIIRYQNKKIKIILRLDCGELDTLYAIHHREPVQSNRFIILPFFINHFSHNSQPAFVLVKAAPVYQCNNCHIQ